METNLVPLPNEPEVFTPTEAEVEKAHNLQQEFLSNAEDIDMLFERQVEILLELHRNLRLCQTLGYETVWEFLSDPEIRDAMRVKVGSRSQLYRLLRLAQVNERFPRLQVLREPRLTKLTHTTVLPRLEALNENEEDKAMDILQETRSSTFGKLDSGTYPQVEVKGSLIWVDGEVVLKIHNYTTLSIRAISKIMHLSPPPRFQIQAGQLFAWFGETEETIGNLITHDESLIEYIRDRLQATRIS